MDNTTMDIKEIKEILPHRYPFLLVDKVLKIDLENNTILAAKNLTINEHFFQGHFPEKPIMPGVLIVEALAQAGAILVHKKGIGQDKLAVLLKISEVKFRRAVTPGDVLTLDIEGIHFSNKGGKIKGRALVDGQLAAQAEITFALTEK